MNIKNIFRNPITIWLNSLIRNYIIQRKNYELHIGYMSYVNNCKFGKYVFISDNDSLQNVCIDDFSYVGNNTSILNTSIGKYCSIANNVFIGPGKHPTHFVSLHPIFYRDNSRAGFSFTSMSEFSEYEEVKIGNDVWIGANSIVMPGVKVSDGVIIAAGAVVTKDIPPYAIAGGVPAKVIKYRFDDITIDNLKKIKWWDRDPNYLKQYYKKFHSIELFTEHFTKID